MPAASGPTNQISDISEKLPELGGRPGHEGMPQ
jgi:hypothetical protein